MTTKHFLLMCAVAAGVLAATASVRGADARAAAAVEAQAPVEPLPDAPGKAVVERVCTTCHGTDYLWPSERTAPVWKETVALMKSYGAAASEEDWKAIGDYVLLNLAYLGVNKAPAEDIAAVIGIDQKTAQAVVGYRDAQGGFKTIEDVKKAPGLDAARVDALKARLKFD